MENLSGKILESQLKCVLSDHEFDAIKIGMISDISFVKKIKKLFKKKKIPIVIDPVLKSSLGKYLVKKDKFISIQRIFASVSTLITPTIFEASILGGIKIKNIDDMKNFCKKFYSKNGCSVLLKGNEIENGKVIRNILYHNEKFYNMKFKKINNRNTHGTGCTFSATIAFYLASGEVMKNAIEKSQKFVSKSIINSPNFDLDYGPLGL